MCCKRWHANGYRDRAYEFTNGEEVPAPELTEVYLSFTGAKGEPLSNAAVARAWSDSSVAAHSCCRHENVKTHEFQHMQGVLAVLSGKTGWQQRGIDGLNISWWLAPVLLRVARCVCATRAGSRYRARD